MNSLWKNAWNFYVVTTVARATLQKHKSGISNYGEVFDTLDLSRVDSTSEQGGTLPEFLRVKFPKAAGSPFVAHFYNLPPSGVTALACPFAPSDNLYLRYHVRFPKGFDFSSSGNLPGVAGGILNQAEGTYSASFFSIWLGWNKQGFIEYGGFLDKLNAPRVSTKTFSADGEWHMVEMYIRSNVPPMHKMNGAIEIRYDGKSLLSVQSATVRARQEDKFECLALVAFAGATDTISNLKKDSSVDVGGFVVSSKAMWQ